MTVSPVLSPAALPFRKMHGLGNDFVVIDARRTPLSLAQPQLERIADRRFGIGCDQLILLEPSARGQARMRIFNPDGGEVEACGNATRCIASLLTRESGASEAVIETVAGLLVGRMRGHEVSVDMGRARFDWADIPLAGEPRDTARIALDTSALSMDLPGWFSAVNMGNPHGIFFVEDARAIDLARIGPKLETHPIFPQKANISFASAIGRNAYRVFVWERAAGATLACGTAACAVASAIWRLGMAKGAISIVLPGGSLLIEQDGAGHVIMTGPASESFTGELSAEWLAEAS